jgi:hypothetical protein
VNRYWTTQNGYYETDLIHLTFQPPIRSCNLHKKLALCNSLNWLNFFSSGTIWENVTSRSFLCDSDVLELMATDDKFHHVCASSESYHVGTSKATRAYTTNRTRYPFIDKQCQVSNHYQLYVSNAVSPAICKWEVFSSYQREDTCYYVLDWAPQCQKTAL